LNGKEIRQPEIIENPFNFAKGDVAGEFRFGGSTTLTLFGKDKVTFNQDILDNSVKGLETLVTCCSEIGRLNA